MHTLYSIYSNQYINIYIYTHTYTWYDIVYIYIYMHTVYIRTYYVTANDMKPDERTLAHHKTSQLPNQTSCPAVNQSLGHAAEMVVCLGCAKLNPEFRCSGCAVACFCSKAVICDMTLGRKGLDLRGSSVVEIADGMSQSHELHHTVQDKQCFQVWRVILLNYEKKCIYHLQGITSLEACQRRVAKQHRPFCGFSDLVKILEVCELERNWMVELTYSKIKRALDCLEMVFSEWSQGILHSLTPMITIGWNLASSRSCSGDGCRLAHPLSVRHNVRSKCTQNTRHNNVILNVMSGHSDLEDFGWFGFCWTMFNCSTPLWLIHSPRKLMKLCGCVAWALRRIHADDLSLAWM